MRTIVLLIILCCPALLAASTQLEIRDTSLSRGIKSRIPIYSYINSFDGDSLDIAVRFNRYLLAYTAVYSSQVNLSIISAVENYSPPDSTTTLLISGRSHGVALAGHQLLTIEFEALAGPDSFALLQLTSFRINTKEPQDLVLRNGRVSILASRPILSTRSEYLNTPVPNPFRTGSTLEFYTLTEGAVVFRMFDLLGREVFSESYVAKTPGVNHFPIVLGNNQIANGLYILRMQTKNGVYDQGCFVGSYTD